MTLIRKTVPHHLFTEDVKFLQKVVVFHPKKKDLFLAMKRPETAKSRPSCWDLPGGNVTYGERHDVSLRREIVEETSLEVSEMTPVHVITNYDEINKIYYLFIGYKAQAISEEIHLSREHTEYKWVDQKEFLELKSADYLQDHVMKVFEQVST
ncbi:MAG: NUDIX domain-containing protein [Patescibacteria group bacterium]